MLNPAREAVKHLTEKMGEKIAAVALFGSLARGEAGGRSDVDLLVVVRGLPSGMERRFTIYDAVHKTVGVDVTIVDVDEEEFLREDLEVTPLLVNIAWDGLVLHDPGGRLSETFRKVRGLVSKLNLERYRTQDGKYGWKPVAAGRLKAVEA